MGNFLTAKISYFFQNSKPSSNSLNGLIGQKRNRHLPIFKNTNKTQLLNFAANAWMPPYLAWWPIMTQACAFWVKILWNSNIYSVRSGLSNCTLRPKVHVLVLTRDSWEPGRYDCKSRICTKFVVAKSSFLYAQIFCAGLVHSPPRFSGSIGAHQLKNTQTSTKRSRILRGVRIFNRISPGYPEPRVTTTNV